VCPTEILAFSDRMEDFVARGARVALVSCDSAEVHLAWARTPRSRGGLGPEDNAGGANVAGSKSLRVPLLADTTMEVSRAFGTLDEAQGIPYRGTFLIDPRGVLRHASVGDFPVGRSVDEVLRLLDAFAHYDEHGDVCPAGWQTGDRTMTADPDASRAYFEAVAAEAAAGGGGGGGGTAATAAAAAPAADAASAPGGDVAAATSAADVAAALEAARASGAAAVALDFWSPACGKCAKLSPTIERLAAETRGSIKWLSVEAPYPGAPVDPATGPVNAWAEGLPGGAPAVLPAVRFYEASTGAVVGETIGYKPASLERAAAKAAGRGGK